MPIPALSAAESPDEVGSAGEEPPFEPVEEGLDWPDAVGEAVAEGSVSLMRKLEC